MGYYGYDGWWVEGMEGQDPPPNGQWRIDPMLLNPPPTSYEPPGMNPGQTTPMGMGANPPPPSPQEEIWPWSPTTPVGAGFGAPAAGGAGGTTGGAAGGGPLLAGFSNMAQQQAWQQDYLSEHNGVAPYSWDRAAEERLGGIAWSGMHGSPFSWGNRPGDTRVPLNIWQRISSARRSPDYGPQGPQGWAEAADMIGGALAALQGGGTTARNYNYDALLQALMGIVKPKPISQLYQILWGQQQ